MNSQPSSAMENGLTSQLIPTVTAMPRQCSRTSPSAPKSIFSSIGTIISQISAATGRFTCATSAAPMAWKTPGSAWPSSDAGNDAQRHPDRQEALEGAERRRPRLGMSMRGRLTAAHGARPPVGSPDGRQTPLAGKPRPQQFSVR